MTRGHPNNRLPRNERRNYKSVFDAWRRIVKEEGVTTLWTGCVATVYRAMVVNVCTLCCQTQAKQEIHERFQGSFFFTKKLLYVFFKWKGVGANFSPSTPILCWYSKHWY